MSLEYGILGFLSKKDLSGYDIKKAFDIAAGFIWPANQGQIYRTLGTMLKNGWVIISETSPGIVHDKKTYSITDEGKKAFRKWLVDGLSESPMRNEALLKLFHFAQANPEKALENLNKLIKQKKMMTSILDEMTISKAGEYREMLDIDENSPEFKLNLFISKWGYIREKVFLEFLEMYKTEFEKIIKQQG